MSKYQFGPGLVILASKLHHKIMKLSRTGDPVAKYQFAPKFVTSASKLYNKNNDITKSW